MRNAAVLFLTMLMIMVMIPAASPEQHMEEEFTTVEIIMEIGATTYTVDGESHTMDAGPFIDNGRTMVPLRFLAEAFGLEADWGPQGDSTRWVTLTNEEMLIELEIGSTEIRVTEDGVTRTEMSDVAAQIRNDRTYLPLRSVGEIFGAEFDWGPKEASTEWISFTYMIKPEAVEPEDEVEIIEEQVVILEGYAFNPQILTVSAGTRVTWTNNDADSHTVTSPGNFESGVLGIGETFSFVFADVGTFDYFCTPHPFMVGTIIVE